MSRRVEANNLMKTKAIVAIFTVVLSLFCGSSVCDADGFDSVRCGSDVRKALLGRKMSNEKIVVLEERHLSVGCGIGLREAKLPTPALLIVFL